jgi:hypothetical protein
VFSAAHARGVERPHERRSPSTTRSRIVFENAPEGSGAPARRARRWRASLDAARERDVGDSRGRRPHFAERERQRFLRIRSHASASRRGHQQSDRRRRHEQPGGWFSDAEYQSIAVTFDTLSTRSIAPRSAPSDIDGNGHVICSSRAPSTSSPPGALGVTLGFFFPGICIRRPRRRAVRRSNFAEMFYLLVPDTGESSTRTSGRSRWC